MTCVDTPFYASPKTSLLTPEPHHVPGYAGYLPQEKFRPGNTFGMTSHRVLIDPCIHMSPRPILTNIHPENCTDEYGRTCPQSHSLEAKVALLNARTHSFGRQQYQANMTPGYTGYVPRFQTILGHTFSPACNRALASFEQEQWRDRLFKRELEALDGWRFCYRTKPWESPEFQRDPSTDYKQFLRGCNAKAASKRVIRVDPSCAPLSIAGCSACG